MSEELPSLKDVEELSPSDVNVTDAIDLSCRTVVVRMGERLGEFAIEFDGDMSAQVHVNKWQLFVYEVNPNDIADNSKNLDNETFSPLEQTGTEVTFNSILEPSKNSKIVKLAPGKVYRCGTRFHTDRWSAWSAPVMTSSFHSVVVHPSDIGEDSIRLCWGRAAERFLEGCAAELDSLSTKAVGDIAKFQLRVTRQRDNVREFDEEFDSSVRSVTVHSLIPGTAYVVEMRYESLLQTFFNWSEVLRFYTDAPMYVELLSRGEDVFSISWRREDLPPDTIGYRLPTTEVLFYELHIDGEGSSGTSIEIPAKDSTYRATQLFPGGEYSVYLRCLTKDGRWGGRSRVLEVRTACIPDLELLSVGESFLTVRWVRRVDEPGETRLEYELYELRGGYRHGMSLTGSTEVDTGKKYFTVSDLSPSTEYSVSVRLYVDGEWGRWTEPKSFFTNSKPALTLLERGEDFFTVKWPKVDGASSKTAAPQYNIVVKKRNENGPHSVILDQNVTPDSNPGFRVNNLDTDGVYEMTCRVLQVDDLTHTQLWGDYSPPLTVRTLRPVAVEVWDLGEDFVHVVWKHGLTDRGDSQANQNWRILKYEVVVGCMDTQEDEILHREVLDTNYLIKNLRPSFTYIISVRAFSERHQWGVWSKVTVRTFAPVRTSIHEIGEDYVRLMWHRRNTSQETESTETISAANYVSQYSILVFSVSDTEEDNVADDVSGYPRGGSARVVRRMTVPSYHSSLLINNLLPNLKYEAVVQASTESGKWGLWSTPLHFRTNSQVTIPVDNLSIGENYVNLEWERTAAPASSEENVQVGDLTIVAQQLRIRGVQGSAFSKDYNLKAEDRTLKVDGLSPATAYSVCIRVCGKSGLWGLWSQPIHVLTRGTILTKTVEVAENYIITAWERAKVPNPNRYPTGRGVVTTYHLRVYNQEGTHTETFLGDGDCPYRVSNLKPDTYYCVELKANYNDEEWGQWSTPMWCLTMPSMHIKAQLISEEFCRLSITRAAQQHRLPEDDGNKPSEDKIVSFGQLRSHLILCVTAPILTRTPHSTSGATVAKHHNSALPPDAAEHRLIYQTEIISTSAETEHVVPNLKSNTVYSVSVRSKLPNGNWGMWAPSMMFITVPTTCLVYNDIGENFIRVEWKRNPQHIPPQISGSVVQGLGTISASRVRVREVGGAFQETYAVENSLRTMRIDNLQPATTYAIAVQTYNDNFNWGVWSDESFARTVPGLHIDIQHVSEDALWVAWARRTDVQDLPDTNTALNVNVTTMAYEVCLTGAGNFRYARELETDSLFFRGLQPDSVYTIHVRVQFMETEEWGLWSSLTFRTKPTLRVTFGNIGEHFAVLEWRRHLSKPTEDGIHPSTIVDTEDIVLQYRFRVQRVGDDTAKVYNLNPNLSSFRLGNLQPSSEFRVWVCACGYEGVWGCWSEESRVRTIPKLELDVLDIGEDYVRVTWKRGKWNGQCLEPSDDVEVRQVDGAVSGYQVRVLDDNGEVVSTQNTSFRETVCVVTGLKLRSIYSVEVAAKDTYNLWGLWSDTRRFLTLQAVKTRLLRIGECFVDVEWYRRGDPVGNKPSTIRRSKTNSNFYYNQDEEESDKAISLLDNIPDDVIREEDTISQWHVRVQSPSGSDVAVFYADPTECSRRVENLSPNCPYKISVRAMNKAKEWGHWSRLVDVSTYPLLQVSLDTRGETYLQISWKREDWTSSLDAKREKDFICFPDISDAHNYYVNIKPLPGESPFDEADEPLPDGSRGYETTQPSIRVGNLRPGTRYEVVVCEQLIDDEDEFIPFTYGKESSAAVYETVAAIHVRPVEIGEDYCLLEWSRVESRHQETDEPSPEDAPPKEESEYEVRIRRLQEDGISPYQTSPSTDTIHSVTSANCQLLVNSLSPSAIYEVSVRAKGERDTWGPWCSPTKLLTQSRLQLTVDAVLETTVIVSWKRPLPAWAENGQGRDSSGVAFIEAETDTHLESSKSALRDVLFGDNTIQDYELVVEGVSCSYKETYTFYKEQLTAKLTKLSHNALYTICVRSLSMKQHWSVFSNKTCVLTLGALQLSTKCVTENIAVLRWTRALSDLKSFSAILKASQKEVERLCEEREKKELFELKRRVQEDESAGAELEDQESRNAQNALLRREALQHLESENIVLGDASKVSAYHFRMSSESCTSFPIIDNVDTIMLENKGSTNQLKKSERRKAGKKGVDDFDHTLNGTVFTLLQKSNYLVDVSLKSRVDEIVIRNLSPNATFSFELCSRLKHVNGEEWQAWSERETFQTLYPLYISQKYFHEGCVELFWNRFCNDELHVQLLTLNERLSELRSSLKGVTLYNIEEKRDALTEEEYSRYKTYIDELSAVEAESASCKEALMAQFKGVLVHPDTPIKGYHLRAVHESGTFTDVYIRNEKNVFTHTVNALEGNCMYAFLLCPDYGNGLWGCWTGAVKVLTPNTLQVNIKHAAESYVDVEWRRLSNKRVPLVDRGDTVTLEQVLTGERRYQLHFIVENIMESIKMEETVEISGDQQYRIGNLKADSKCSIRVRETDSRGGWGSWSATRSCTTLPKMGITAEKIKECSVFLSWDRESASKAYDDDVHVLQFNTEASFYFIRLQELKDAEEEDAGGRSVASTRLPPSPEDDDINANETKRLSDTENENGASTAASETDPPSDDDQDSVDRTQEGRPDTAPLVQGEAKNTVDPKDLTEFSGVDERGLYVLKKRFEYDTHSFEMTGLKPDTMYLIQALAVSDSSDNSAKWCAPRYFRTLKRMFVNVVGVTECHVDVSWGRENNQTEGTFVYVSDYAPHSYVLDITAPGDSSFHVTKTFDNTQHSTRIDNLNMNTDYCIRVCGKEDDAAWSDVVGIRTLGPVHVEPTLVTQDTIVVTWTRFTDAARMPPTITSDPSAAGQHILRLSRTNDGGERVLLREEHLRDTNVFKVAELQPNTPFYFAVRSTDKHGDWGPWTEECCVRTLPVMELKSDVVGDHYVQLRWAKASPMEKTRELTVEENDDSSFRDAQGPSGYTIKYSTTENGDPIARVSVPGEETSFLLETLEPSTEYHISIQPIYEAGETVPGMWSSPIVISTTASVKVHLRDIGEDCFSMDWKLPPFETIPNFPERVVCYEILVRRVTVEGKDVADPSSDQLYYASPNDSKYSIQNLLSSSEYMTRMRFWYKPPVCASSLFHDSDELDQVANGRIKDALLQAEAIASVWSRFKRVSTLRDVVCAVSSIREDSFTVSWSRGEAPIAEGETEGADDSSGDEERYHVQLHVDELAEDGTVVKKELTGHDVEEELDLQSALHIVRKLQPDTIYIVTLRCRMNQVWGQWTAPLFVRTTPRFTVTATRITEDSVNLSWKRTSTRRLTTPDEVKVVEPDVSALVDRYQLEIYAPYSNTVQSKRFKGNRVSYQARDLEAGTLYMVQIRASDGVQPDWGSWSSRLYFATLKPLSVSVVQAAEYAAKFVWKRLPQSSEEYTEKTGGAAVMIGEPVSMAYHVCVFDADTTPSESVLERQLHPDVTSFVAHGLRPVSNYVGIVRSCNIGSEFGLWSEEAAFSTRGGHTLSKSYAGEDYVILTWTSGATTGVHSPPQSYVILVRTPSGDVFEKIIDITDCVAEKDTPSSLSYRVGGLAPGTEYLFTLQPNYGELGMGDFAPTLTCSTLSSLSLSATPVQNQIRIQFGRPTFRNVDFAESLTDGSALPTVVRYDVRVCLTELSERVFLSSMNASVEEKERKSRRSMCVFSKVFDSDDVFSTKEIRYTITDLEIDTCYTVGVRSMDATGVWCDWVMREVFTPPVAPSNVALYRASPHVASLQWQPIGPRGVYRYCVECYYVADPATGNKKSAPEWREVDQVELHVCGFRLSGPFSRLRCRVRSIRTDCLNRPASEHSYSEYSPTVSVSEGSPPVGVEQLQVAVLSRNSATIEWTSSHANTKKTSFKVYLSSKGGHLTLVSTEQHSVVVLRDLLPMTEYVTEIVAQNNNGISHNNPRIRFTTKAENDSTTTYYEEGMPSLGSVALPGEKDKSSRLIPAPPSKSAKGSTRSSRMSNLLKPESSGSSFAADGPVRSSSRNFSEQRPRSSRTHTIQKSISKPRPSTTTGRDAEGSARTSRLY